MDHAGQMWITAFNEVAEQMMGISANDLHALKDEGNEVEFNKYFQTCVGKTFTFQMMAKQDTYQVRLLIPRVKSADCLRIKLGSDINVGRLLCLITSASRHTSRH